MKERANAALGNLQRKAYAMAMLRSRIESRINTVASNGNAESVTELNRLLDLVKNGELILKDVSDKVDSARFLEDFVQIINGAAESVNDIKEDVEELVPMAEAALAEMHDAISHVSKIMSHDGRQDIDPSILAQASAEIALAKVPSKQEIEKEKASAAQIVVSRTEEKHDELEEIAI
jgi:hypothetical protein